MYLVLNNFIVYLGIFNPVYFFKINLQEGDRVGMIRKSNGNLHYFINGLDQGIAAKVPVSIWGVIDLYGMTVKVTIVDRDEREEQNLITRRNTLHLQSLNGRFCFLFIYFYI